MTLLLQGCGARTQRYITGSSVPVQFKAKVDSTLDGCGKALCVGEEDESGRLCAFPKGIPYGELTEGSSFFIQGNLSSLPPSNEIGICMGMVSHVLEIQNYRKLID